MREVKADLLFYTQQPEAWHATVHAEYTNLKMGGNKSIRQLYTNTEPKFNMNFYNNGTIMIQGSQIKLEEFEREFPRLKALAEKLRTICRLK